MTHREILERAIQKAIDGGWKPWAVALNPKFTVQAVMSQCNWAEVIFNHQFAKALWGEDQLRYRDVFPDDEWNASEILAQHAWQYYLQQMVIADDPIRYLGEHLPE